LKPQPAEKHFEPAGQLELRPGLRLEQLGLHFELPELRLEQLGENPSALLPELAEQFLELPELLD